MKDRNDILNGVLYKQILLFFFPILFGTLFQLFYNTVDAIVVGNYVGKEALAAVGGSAGTLMNMLVNFITGVASGATVVIAQCYGNNDDKGVRSGVRSGMFLAIVMGGILMVIGFILAPFMLRLTKVPQDIMGMSVLYMRVYYFGLVPSLIYNMGSGILRAIGDSKRPFYFLVASALTNVVLDILFVVVFHMGVAGVGLATVISQCVSASLILLSLSRTSDSYHFVLRDFGFEKDLLIKIVLIGIPAGLQSVLYSVSNLFIHSSVNTFGTDTVAAYTVFGKIDEFFWAISGALGNAALTIVGQNFGALKIERVKKAIWTALWMYLVMSALLSSTMLLCGRFMMSMFTKDEVVKGICWQMLRFLAPTWGTFAVVEIFSSSLKACGDSLNSMLLTVFGVCAIRIGWILFFPYHTVVEALYCYPLSWVFTSLLFLVYYFKSGWLQKCIRKRNLITK